MNEPVILRYFPIAGRAQALRHALHEAGVRFEDLRVSGAEWAEHQTDPSYAGPFVSLPTLTWGADTIGETLAIASFLGRRLGHYDGLDDAAIARIESIISCCYLEVLGSFAAIFWAERLYPGCDLAQAFPRHLTRALEKLARVEAMAPAGPGWLLPGRDRPSCADFFTGEAVEALRYVLGEPREPAVRARLPRLSALADRLRQLPALAPAWSNRPTTFTWARAEGDILEQLRAL
jgi:glutathione S-transferase